MIDWQLTPSGITGRGKKTYYIFKTFGGAALQVYGNRGYERLGTFAGDDAFREARKAAADHDRALMNIRDNSSEL